MGLPVVTLCAKLKLVALSSHGSSTVARASPLLTGFLCPYLVKLACSLQLVSRAYFDAIHSSRLFFFQLGRIAFDDITATVTDTDGEEEEEDDHHLHRQQVLLGNRWGRAVRLICQRISLARTPNSQTDEDSFHALSMFAL